MGATEKATALGAEHGTRAAEEWLTDVWGEMYPNSSKGLVTALDQGIIPQGWPQPYLQLGTANALWEIVDAYTADDRFATCQAYEAMFTAAVETTIREKVQS